MGMIRREVVRIMPYVKKHLKKRKRSTRLNLVFCVLIAVLAGVISLFYTRSFTVIGGSRTTSSALQEVKSIVSSSESQTSVPSSAGKDSSVSKVLTVGLQDAVKPLWIDVSIEEQTLTVYDAGNQMVENWLCSTGSPGYETPKGIFSVYKRGESFYNPEYQEGAYYYVAFYKDYYIHSVPFDKDRKIIPTIANDLGHEDSHGCVHLSIEDSKWVYDNIPDGTKIIVD